MNTRYLKIAAAAMVLFFMGTGVSLAKDYRARGSDKHPGQAYGYYKHKGPPAHAYGPRYTYQQPRHHHHQIYRSYHHQYPVVVQKHYYSPPSFYYAPAPSGYYFGFSAYDPGFAFSFGASGR